MLERAWLIHGVAALALLMPPRMMAQLPDAPSAVKARRLAESSASMDAEEADPALHVVSEQGRVPAWSASFSMDAGSADASSLDAKQPQGGGSGSRWNTWEMADALEDAPTGQQSLAPAYRANLGPGRSSSAAELLPVPGNAPALYNACPADACAVAEDRLCCGQAPSPFARYLKRPDVVPMTARDNLRSAARGVIDPFNFLTIAVDAAIGIGSDPDTPYGPGMKGFAKYAGVSLTEDMTGEFFGTFLVPSLMHQDPHYHREPFKPIRHRILHAFTQIVWTQSYSGTPMFNYANFVGGAATAAVSNTFVPGPNRQGFGNTATRLAIAFAISPSSNLIAEFLPDVASRINLRVVIFQRILNTVTFEESGVR